MARRTRSRRRRIRRSVGRCRAAPISRCQRGARIVDCGSRPIRPFPVLRRGVETGVRVVMFPSSKGDVTDRITCGESVGENRSATRRRPPTAPRQRPLHTTRRARLQLRDDLRTMRVLRHRTPVHPDPATSTRPRQRTRPTRPCPTLRRPHRPHRQPATRHAPMTPAQDPRITRVTTLLGHPMSKRQGQLRVSPSAWDGSTRFNVSRSWSNHFWLGIVPVTTSSKWMLLSAKKTSPSNSSGKITLSRLIA